MLVLSRRGGEEINIGDHVTILVVKIGRGEVRLGVVAPKEVPVHRAEIAARISNESCPKKLAKERA
jgi:carbon storage regulator